MSRGGSAKQSACGGRAQKTLGPDDLVEPLLRGRRFDRVLPLVPRLDLGRALEDGTILHLAVAVGAVEVTRALLARGADPSAVDRWGKKPIDLAKASWEDDKASASELIALLSPPAETVTTPSDPLAVGKRAHHAKYGEGEITAVAPDGKLTIRFRDQSRVLLPRFVTAMEG